MKSPLSKSYLRYISLTAFLSFIFTQLVRPQSIYAAPPPFTFAQPPQFSITSIGTFIGSVISLIFIIAGVLIFVYIAWGAFQWITAGGDKSQTQAARERISGALIGFSIFALLVAITLLAEYFFGIDIIGSGSIPKGY